jgi:hypothetical protein
MQNKIASQTYDLRGDHIVLQARVPHACGGCSPTGGFALLPPRASWANREDAVGERVKTAMFIFPNAAGVHHLQA